jgi:hypothetical protein
VRSVGDPFQGLVLARAWRFKSSSGQIQLVLFQGNRKPPENRRLRVALSGALRGAANLAGQLDLVQAGQSV